MTYIIKPANHHPRLEKNELGLPSNFISLTMPNPTSNESSENLLNISCFFED